MYLGYSSLSSTSFTTRDTFTFILFDTFTLHTNRRSLASWQRTRYDKNMFRTKISVALFHLPTTAFHEPSRIAVSLLSAEFYPVLQRPRKYFWTICWRKKWFLVRFILEWLNATQTTDRAVATTAVPLPWQCQTVLYWMHQWHADVVPHSISLTRWLAWLLGLAACLSRRQTPTPTTELWMNELLGSVWCMKHHMFAVTHTHSFAQRD